ncbi:MAG TPA: DUF1844 domain-containing protein [Bryobacteraceae bacterium]|nr:DUF1844 domain-containing protein [Bryobacteraceae bacterium]
MSDTEKEPTPAPPESTGAPAEAAGASEAAPEIPVPPATFEFLVLRTMTEAQMFLGLLRFGDEKDQARPNLRAAQHAIDMLAMLLEKTRGNLNLDESRLLENSLTELRFRYVQVAESGHANG